MAGRAKPAVPNVRAQRGSFLKLLTVALLGTGLVLLLFIWWLGPTPESDSETQLDESALLEDASQLLVRGDFAAVEKIADEINGSSPLYHRSRLLAGEAAFRAGSVPRAIELYSQIAEESSADALQASFALAEIFRGEGRLEEAFQRYFHVYQHDRRDVATNERLAFLLAISGQKWEAMPHYLALIKTQNWSLDSLAMLGDIERAIEQPAYIASVAKQRPQDPWVMLSQAALALTDGKEDTARPILTEVVAQRPQWFAAQAMLGETLLSADVEAYIAWEKSLPREADTHPDIWFVRGLRARGMGQMDVATGCFAEAVRLRPEHRRATYQLSQVLELVGEGGAEPFVARTNQQVELGQAMDMILKSRGADVKSMRRAAELSRDMGRLWEAWAWAITVGKMHPQEIWAAPLANEVSQQLVDDLPRTVEKANLVSSLDLTKYIAKAREANERIDKSAMEPVMAGGNQLGKIRFAVENERGIDFVYNNGPDEATPGVRMFEQTGGGVGVIDYDADGWPDLFFPQGAAWKTGRLTPDLQSQYRDCLMRNLEGNRFVDIAELAGVAGLEYSQGVAVGDYDGDGFADLYVGHIGQNLLYRNNGDGTFQQVSDQLGSALQQWTTSCAMIDLDGDGLLDLYDVNYLQGEGVYELICNQKGCSPKVFAGSPDQIHLSNGDGSFRLLSNATPQRDAKGLGILAAIFGEENKLSLFIANDQVPNFFLTSSEAADGGIRFQDRALLRGLAYNVDGLAMACMGIAADDVDGNGRVDLLVTNFADEPNSLYLQDAPGLFVDATRASGMQGPSFPYVGWGAQFLDADLDGNVDLVVTNGHVADYRDTGGMYRMPPQFYRGLGKGRFEVLSPEEAGDYFQGQYLGRGLARVDWNRDGKPDFVVSNIGTPAALVTNQSEQVGQFVNVRLCGTVSSRDPFGTMVTVETERGRWTKQLTGGDGYQASNERVLRFGLGGSEEVRRVQIRWPNGDQQYLGPVSLGSTLLVVQGRPQAVTEQGEWVGPLNAP